MKIKIFCILFILSFYICFASDDADTIPTSTSVIVTNNLSSSTSIVPNDICFSYAPISNWTSAEKIAEDAGIGALIGGLLGISFANFSEISLMSESGMSLFTISVEAGSYVALAGGSVGLLIGLTGGGTDDSDLSIKNNIGITIPSDTSNEVLVIPTKKFDHSIDFKIRLTTSQGIYSVDLNSDHLNGTVASQGHNNTMTLSLNSYTSDESGINCILTFGNGSTQTVTLHGETYGSSYIPDALNLGPANN